MASVRVALLVLLVLVVGAYLFLMTRGSAPPYVPPDENGDDPVLASYISATQSASAALNAEAQSLAGVTPGIGPAVQQTENDGCADIAKSNSKLTSTTVTEVGALDGTTQGYAEKVAENDAVVAAWTSGTDSGAIIAQGPSICEVVSDSTQLMPESLGSAATNLQTYVNTWDSTYDSVACSRGCSGSSDCDPDACSAAGCGGVTDCDGTPSACVEGQGPWTCDCPYSSPGCGSKLCRRAMSQAVQGDLAELESDIARLDQDGCGGMTLYDLGLNLLAAYNQLYCYLLALPSPPCAYSCPYISGCS